MGSILPVMPDGQSVLFRHQYFLKRHEMGNAVSILRSQGVAVPEIHELSRLAYHSPTESETRQELSIWSVIGR